MEFRQINGLPPYVFTIINDLIAVDATPEEPAAALMKRR